MYAAARTGTAEENKMMFVGAAIRFDGRLANHEAFELDEQGQVDRSFCDRSGSSRFACSDAGSCGENGCG
jgi:hypothetical protein